MKVTIRNYKVIQDAIHNLFYIKCHTDEEDLKHKCRDMIDNLFEKFPGVMPVPSRSLAKQSSDVVDQLTIAMKG